MAKPKIDLKNIISDPNRRKEMGELLSLFDAHSMFLFDTETTNTRFDASTQLWEVGGVLVTRIGDSVEVKSYHEYIKPSVAEEDIPEKETMFYRGVPIKTRDFFYGTGPRSLREVSKGRAIPESELFGKMPFLGNKSVILAAYNVGFDKKVLEMVGRRNGRSLSGHRFLDFQAVMLNVMPSVYELSLEKLTDAKIRKITSDPVLQKQLKQASEAYKGSMVLKSGNGDQVTKAAYDAAVKEYGISPELADFHETKKFKLGAERYNLDKMRAFFATDIYVRKALDQANRQLRLGMPESEIASCVSDISSIATNYGLRAAETHRADDDTVQMIGLGIIASKLSTVFHVSKSNMRGLLGVFVGTGRGEVSVSFLSRMINGTSSAEDGEEHLERIFAPGLVSKAAGGLVAKPSATELVTTQYNKFRKACHSDASNESVQRICDDIARIRSSNKSSYDQIIDDFARHEGPNVIDAIDNDTVRNDIWERRKKLNYLGSSSRGAITAPKGDRLSERGKVIASITRKKPEDRTPEERRMLATASTAGASSKKFSGYVQQQAFRGTITDGEGKPVPGDTKEVIDQVVKKLAGIPHISVKPSPTYEENHIYDIYYDGYKYPIGSKKGKFKDDIVLRFDEDGEVVEHRVLIRFPLDIDRSNKTVKNATIEYEHSFGSVDVPSTRKGHKKESVPVRTKTFVGYDRRGNPMQYSRYEHYDDRKGWVPGVWNSATGKWSVANCFLDSTDRMSSDDVDTLMRSSWYDMLSTTSLAKEILGNKYDDYHIKKLLKLLGDKKITTMQEYVDAIDEAVKKQKDPTIKGTKVHAVIDLVEKAAAAGTIRDANEIYEAIITFPKKKLPPEIFSSLAKILTNGRSENIPDSWDGINELATWAAMRKTLGISGALKTETAIGARLTYRGRRILLTGSADAVDEARNLLLDFKNTQWLDPDNPSWYFQLSVYREMLRLQGKPIDKTKIVALAPAKIRNGTFIKYIVAHINDGFERMSYEDFVKFGLIEPTANERAAVDYGGSILDAETGNKVENLFQLSGRFIKEWINDYYKLVTERKQFVALFGGEGNINNLLLSGSDAGYAMFKERFPGITHSRYKILCKNYDFLNREEKAILDVFKRAWTDDRKVAMPSGSVVTYKQALKYAITNFMRRHGEDDMSSLGIKSYDEFFNVVADHIGTSRVRVYQGNLESASGSVMGAWYEPASRQEREEAIKSFIEEYDANEKRRTTRLDSNELKGVVEEEASRKEFHRLTATFLRSYCEFQEILASGAANSEKGLILLRTTASQLNAIHMDIQKVVGDENFLMGEYNDFVDALENGNVSAYISGLQAEDSRIFKETFNLARGGAAKYYGRAEFEERLNKAYGQTNSVAFRTFRMLFESLFDIKESDPEKIAHYLAAEATRKVTFDKMVRTHVDAFGIKDPKEVAKFLSSDMQDKLAYSGLLRKAIGTFVVDYRKLFLDFLSNKVNEEDFASQLRDKLLSIFNAYSFSSAADNEYMTYSELQQHLDNEPEEGEAPSVGVSDANDPFLRVISQVSEMLKNCTFEELTRFSNVLYEQLAPGSGGLVKKEKYQEGVYGSMRVVARPGAAPLVLKIPAIFLARSVTNGTDEFSLDQLVVELMSIFSNQNGVMSDFQGNGPVALLNNIIKELRSAENNTDGKNGNAVALELVSRLSPVGIVWMEGRSFVSYLRAGGSIPQSISYLKGIQGDQGMSYPSDTIERTIAELKDLKKKGSRRAPSFAEVNDVLSQIKDLWTKHLRKGLLSSKWYDFVHEHHDFFSDNKVDFEVDGDRVNVKNATSAHDKWKEWFASLRWGAVDDLSISNIDSLINDLTYFQKHKKLHEEITAFEKDVWEKYEDYLRQLDKDGLLLKIPFGEAHARLGQLRDVMSAVSKELRALADLCIRIRRVEVGGSIRTIIDPISDFKDRFAKVLNDVVSSRKMMESINDVLLNTLNSHYGKAIADHEGKLAELRRQKEGLRYDPETMSLNDYNRMVGDLERAIADENSAIARCQAILRSGKDILEGARAKTKAYETAISYRNTLFNGLKLLISQISSLNAPALRGDGAGSGGDLPEIRTTSASPAAAVSSMVGSVPNLNVNKMTITGQVDIQGNVIVKGDIGKTVSSDVAQKTTTDSETSLLKGKAYEFDPTQKVDVTESVKRNADGSSSYVVTSKGYNQEGRRMTQVATYNTSTNADLETVRGVKLLGVKYDISDQTLAEDQKAAAEEQERKRQQELLDIQEKRLKVERDLATLKKEKDTEEAKTHTEIAKKLEEQIDLLTKKQDKLTALGDLTGAERQAASETYDTEHGTRELESDIYRAETATREEREKVRAQSAREREQDERDREYEAWVKEQTSVMMEMQKYQRQLDITSTFDVTTKRGLTEAMQAAAERKAAIEADPRFIEARDKASQSAIDKFAEQQGLKLSTNERKLRMYRGGSMNMWESLQQGLYNTTRSLTGIGLAYKVIGKVQASFQKVIQYAKELDKVFVNLRIVTGYNEDQTNSLMMSYSQLAKQVGATTSEIATAGNEWFDSQITINSFNCWETPCGQSAAKPRKRNVQRLAERRRTKWSEMGSTRIG